MNTIILKTFDNYFSANICLTRLQSEGVHCWLVDEYTVTIDPILSNAIGGIKLAVDEKDVMLAQELLNQFHEDYMKAATCPRCLQNEIVLIPGRTTQNFLTAILTWVASSYAVSAENVYHCNHCGYESPNLPGNTAYN
jgi:hypothetical protein